jgi:hypothetical protein
MLRPASHASTSTVRSLIFIKAVHTLVWAFFVACILAIWVFALRADIRNAALSIGIVFVEVVVLALNKWRCPLSPIAARFTEDRRSNFDIYLPAWLAGRTMPIFGTLYVAGIALTCARLALATH